jgi:sulfate permease, SulP family
VTGPLSETVAPAGRQARDGNRAASSSTAEDTAAQPAGARSQVLEWLSALFSGTLTGAITVTASVSLAALIFVGDLSVYLDHGIHLALITALLIGLTVSLSGSCGVSIAIPQDRTAPILAIMAGGIAGAAPAGMPVEQIALNVIAAIVAATLITGAFLFALGLARAGGLMRFIPYSVLAGFFAGTGWLLVLGGLRVMTGLDLDTPAGLVALAEAEMAARWLPGVALALAIVGVSRLIPYAAALPLVLAAGATLFFLVMIAGGETLTSLRETGWLLSTPEAADRTALALAHVQVLSGADWALVADQWAGIGTILMISAVSILLTVSALELLSGQEIDVNRELRVAGLANVAAGLAGGMVGFHSLSISSLVIRLGGRTRLAGVFAALTCGAALLFGAQAIADLPRVVVGGLLIFLGFSFLGQWLFATFRRLPHGEYLVIPLILVVIATFGFVSGMLTGLLAALVIFVLNYSRTPVIRYALSGDQARSTVERSLEDERLLRAHGRQTQVLKLRGYLFFGTMAQLSGRIRERADDRDLAALRFAVLDFEQVTGVDSSAAYAFQRLMQTAEQRGFTLILTGLGDTLESLLRGAGLSENGEHFRWFVDLDHGLEWIENRLLSQLGDSRARVCRSIMERLAELFPNRASAVEFAAYLSEISFPAGHELIRQGDPSGDLYFLEEGDVSVYLRLPDGSSARVRRTGSGTVLGELGFYLGTTRTASVVANRPGRAFRLTAAALQRMETEHPEYAAALHRFMADLLAERLLHTTQTLQAVLD